MDRLSRTIERIAWGVVHAMQRVWYSDLNPMRHRLPPGEPLTEDDPIWNIIGIAGPDGPGEATEEKTERALPR